MDSATLAYYNTGDLLLALCCWREARGTAQAARRGVAHVVMNRVLDARARWPRSVRAVILQPYQFSSFNAHDPNAAKFPAPASPVWADCCRAAAEALAGAPDPTREAVFYFSPPLTAPPPCWGDVVLTAALGSLKFYK